MISAIRRAHDVYPTPRELAAAALDMLARELPSGYSPRAILDPGAGEGVWGQCARFHWPQAQIIGVEIRPLSCPPAYDIWIVGDALTADLPPVDLLIGNPPYALAEPLLRRTLPLLTPRGWACVLLRQSFHASQGRRAFWAEFPLALAATVRPRPSFTGGGTDGAEYALFVWQARGRQRGDARLTHLDWRKSI